MIYRIHMAEWQADRPWQEARARLKTLMDLGWVGGHVAWWSGAGESGVPSIASFRRRWGAVRCEGLPCIDQMPFNVVIGEISTDGLGWIRRLYWVEMVIPYDPVDAL